MFTGARQAYEAGMRATASSREVEAAALYKAARQLEACQNGWDQPDRPQRLHEALQYNLRLWTVFQADLSRSDHELPEEIRVNLLRISQFVDRRTFEIMANPEPGKLQTLVDLNRTIAEGLAVKA